MAWSPPLGPVFDREHGCTEAEWLGWLPGAAGPHALTLGPGACATVLIGPGRLRLDWTVLPDRRIALIRLPRLAVHYEFAQLPDEARHAFIRHFDLYMQRGGG